MASGRARLADWLTAWHDGILPDRPRHPLCKKDWQLKIEGIQNSSGVTRAKEVWPDYDFEATYQKVLDRWNKS
jgi:hypothetical protein